jgi:Helix-turn-helix domain
MGEAGICPACRAALLPSRGRPLCVACTRAARQAVPRPLWLFDSVLLRTALAQVNLPAVPAIIRAASGLSQSDLAVIAGWSRSALGLYEHGQRGAVFDIRVVLQFADAVGMPREALLPLVLGDADAGLVAGGVAGGMGADVDRRSFGGVAAGFAVAAVLPEPALPSRVTASHVKYLQACLNSLYHRDEKVGGTALLRPTLRQLHRARRMLKESRYTDAVGRDLLVAVGEIAVCAGWLAFDASDVPLARKLLSEARLLASDAGSTTLSTHVLIELSGQASFAARVSRKVGAAREGVVLAYQAADEARYTPLPGLHAVIAQQHANAASLLGDGPAFRAAIARARRELDRGTQRDEPHWIKVDEADITRMEAIGRANLGDFDAAAALFQEGLDRPGLAPLFRALGHARLAAILAKGGDQAGAITAGMTVLSALEDGLTSIRTLNELRPVRLAVGGTHVAEEFCARFDAAERALASA